MISEFAYKEFCQNRIAILKLLFLFFIKSQIRGTFTKLLYCSQNNTLKVSRSINPLEIIPCLLGYSPDKMLVCTVDVTAGKTGFILDDSPFSANAEIVGSNLELRCFSSKPTISITITC